MEELLKMLKEYWVETFDDKKLFKIEYEEKSGTFYWMYQPLPGMKLEQGQMLHRTTVLSKEFGFIEWLVGKDKLSFIEGDFKGRHFKGDDCDDMIMLLSIHDEPITMLASFISK